MLREGVVSSVWCLVQNSEGIYHQWTNAKTTQEDLNCVSIVYHHSFMKCNKVSSIQAILEEGNLYIRCNKIWSVHVNNYPTIMIF